MKKLLAYTTLCLSTLPSLTHAEGVSAPTLSTGFFLGLGGSYNSVKLDQYMNLIGTSNVYSGSTLLASGNAEGPASPSHNTQSTFAPEVQMGYFKNFTNSPFLWGVKFSYQYLGLTTTDNNIVAPQLGSFTLTNVSGSTAFVGRATIGSVQFTTNHELLLMPFIGHSFQQGNIYLGLGASLFGTNARLYNVTGYADVDGSHRDITGTPINFSSSEWLWGGAAQLGGTYYLDPTWYLDFNYTFAMTGQNTTHYLGTFSSAFSTYTDAGTMNGDVNRRITAQAWTISINKVFG